MASEGRSVHFLTMLQDTLSLVLSVLTMPGASGPKFNPVRFNAHVLWTERLNSALCEAACNSTATQGWWHDHDSYKCGKRD